MKRMSWLDGKKEEIIELYESGKTQTEIAEHFGVSQGSISTRLRKWIVSNPDGNRFRRLEINKEDIRRMYWDEEMHPSQIAKKYGCHKQVITNRMLKWGIPFRTKSEARKGKLNPIYNVGHTEKSKAKMSNAFWNGKRSSFGFSGNWGRVSLYNTPNQGVVKMRSGWEVKTADYLTDNGIDWYYEDVWIDLGYTKYLPDFYLPDYNIFIEVKGRKKGTDVKKVFEARKYNNRILLWDGEELLKRGIIDNCGVSSVNKKYRDLEPMVDDWKEYK
jgi:predicted transcriptional regulator